MAAGLAEGTAVEATTMLVGGKPVPQAAIRRWFGARNTVSTLLGGDPSRGDLRLQVELALKQLELPRLAGAAAPTS